MSYVEECYPKEQDMAVGSKWLPIVEVSSSAKGVGGGMYVLASHEQLSYLIGSLMQMCELTGDVEQRTALKSEIKQRARRWMNDLYHDAGYDEFTGMRDGYKAKKI
jgi:hypothetical protein